MEQRELDIEFNKLGSMNLFASPGSYSSTPQGITTLFNKGDLHPPFPLLALNCQGSRAEGEMFDHRGLSVQPGKQ